MAWHLQVHLRASHKQTHVLSYGGSARRRVRGMRTGSCCVVLTRTCVCLGCRSAVRLRRLEMGSHVQRQQRARARHRDTVEWLTHSRERPDSFVEVRANSHQPIARGHSQSVGACLPPCCDAATQATGGARRQGAWWGGRQRCRVTPHHGWLATHAVGVAGVRSRRPLAAAVAGAVVPCGAHRRHADRHE